MLRLLRSLLTLTFIFFLTLTLTQAQSTVNRVVIPYVEAVANNTGEVWVSAVVSALDEQGQTVPGLRAGDFTLLENNQPIDNKLIKMMPATAPITVTLLLDTSQGMSRPGSDQILLIDRLKDAARYFIENLDEGSLAVYAYNTQIMRLQSFTLDHNLAINQVIPVIQAGEPPQACLYEALLNVVEELGRMPSGQRIVVVIAGPDSVKSDQCQGITSENVFNAATTAGGRIPIFIVGLGKTINQDQVSLAQWTGGQVLPSANPGDLQDLLDIILKQLKQQSLFSYPTQAGPGVVDIKIIENGSRKSDHRQVSIPLRIEPTPTPLPQFSVKLTINLVENKIKMTTEIPPEVILDKVELFIDEKKIQEVISSPFNFEVDTSQMSAGQHQAKINAIAKNGMTAEDEKGFTFIPPTPVPTAIPTPPPGMLDNLSNNKIISLVLIILGIVVFLIFCVIFVYFLYFLLKPKPSVAPIYPTAPPLPVVPDMVTREDELPDFDKTTDIEDFGRIRARLLVVEGQQFVTSSNFDLYKSEITIGRNSRDSNIFNDIPITDQRVSRSQAKIIYRDHKFFIQDRDSKAGTFVDGQKLEPYRDATLQHHSEIKIGDHVRFRLEIISIDPDATLDNVSLTNLATQEELEDKDKTIRNIKKEG